ncbi:MAG TPA: hypothetical protein VLB44_15045, partial [Kofleriaceae bacterium]|nr:hypothetical protein [Kofleriaceae bacterium]
PSPVAQPPAPAAPAAQPPAPAAQPPPPAAQPPPPAATPPAPTKPRVLPRVSTTCAADADCTITSDELVDHPPNTYACCGGCTQLAVSTVSFKAFQAACEKQPPPMCPPIGCVQPIVRAACEAKHCVVKPASR